MSGIDDRPAPGTHHGSAGPRTDADELTAVVRRALDGDDSATERLWGLNSRWVAAIVLAHRPRTSEVDDLMQDVAVKMVSRLHTLRDAEAFRPWLRRITINVCRGAARGARPALRLDRVTGPEGGAGAGPEDERPSVPEDAAGRDAAAHVLEQASTLPVEYREPLLLRCVQSLTYQQIGAILDLPVTTIETRLARARRMLREEIGEDV